MGRHINAIQKLNEQIWERRRTDPKGIIELSKQLTLLLEQDPNELEQVKLNVSLADYYGDLGEFDKSFSLIKKVEPYIDDPALVYLKPYILSATGANLWNMGELSKAQELFLKQYDLARSLKDKKNEAEALNNLGLVQGSHENHTEAAIYYKKSYGLYESLQNHHGMVLALNNLAMSLLECNDLTQAQKICQRALNLLNLSSFDLTMKMSIWDTAGLIYMKSGDYESAFDYLRLSLDLAEKHNYPRDRAIAFFHLGQLYYYQGKSDSALTWLHEALQLIEAAQLKLELLFCHKTIGEIYQKSGDTKKAEHHFSEVNKIKEEISITDS